MKKYIDFQVDKSFFIQPKKADFNDIRHNSYEKYNCTMEQVNSK